MQGVARISIVSVHRFNSSTSGTDWAAGFETLVVAVSFEGYLLSRMLCAVSCATYPHILTLS